MMKLTTKSAIATAKEVADRIAKIALWPIAMLATKIAKENRLAVRWALRNHNGAAYLLAVLWLRALGFAAVVWAIVASTHVTNAMLFGFNLALATKVMGGVLYVLTQAYESEGAFRLYRRRF